jgi:hypothetical protein
MLRDRALLPLLAALAVLPGCERLQPFEQACAARLAPARVEVVTEPVHYTTDLSRSIGDLTTRQSNPWGRAVMGLVTADLKSEVAVSARGLGDRSGSRYCIRPDVTVRLAFSPMTLYVAREHPPGTCAHRLTLEHELKHVRVYRDYLEDVRADIDTKLREKFGGKPMVYGSEAESQAAVRALLDETLAPYVQDAMREVLDLQKLVDSPHEYARLDLEQARCSLGETPVQAAGG